jgi:hypothetical protein
MRRKEMVLTTNHKIIALGLAAALLGGTVGAVVEHSAISGDANSAAATKSAPVAQSSDSSSVQENAQLNDQPGQNVHSADLNAPSRTTTAVATTPVQRTRTQVVTRTVYAQPVRRQQSGWEKHRNILTVALGTGGGALLGGLIGGRKGTAIGAAAGAGSSALYTYKLRKKTNRY